MIFDVFFLSISDFLEKIRIFGAKKAHRYFWIIDLTLDFLQAGSSDTMIGYI